MAAERGERSGGHAGGDNRAHPVPDPDGLDPRPTATFDHESTSTAGADTYELAGIDLRSFLVLQMLDACHAVRVRDLVAVMEAAGFAVAGRPSKVISDALRWEVARGRVARVGRGAYRCEGPIPPTTLRRMRQRVAAVRARGPAPVRAQPLRGYRPLVSPDGPWRYRLRYGLGPPRRPAPPRPVNGPIPIRSAPARST